MPAGAKQPPTPAPTPSGPAPAAPARTGCPRRSRPSTCRLGAAPARTAAAHERLPHRPDRGAGAPCRRRLAVAAGRRGSSPVTGVEAAFGGGFGGGDSVGRHHHRRRHRVRRRRTFACSAPRGAGEMSLDQATARGREGQLTSRPSSCASTAPAAAPRPPSPSTRKSCGCARRSPSSSPWATSPPRAATTSPRPPTAIVAEPGDHDRQHRRHHPSMNYGGLANQVRCHRPDHHLRALQGHREPPAPHAPGRARHAQGA